MKTPRTGSAAWLARLLLPLATAALLLTSSPAAQAHDDLVSSDPASGSALNSVPSKVGLTFDHTPIAINSIVRVEDATGTDQADGPVAIVDNQVAQAVKPDAPPGKYTVVWRVVSADGHPIEGTFTFTAGTANTNPLPAVAHKTPGAGTGAQTGLTVAAAAATVLVIALTIGGVLVRRRLRNTDD